MTQEIRGVFTCANGDSWDWLALAFFGDEKYATDLMNANPEYCGKMVFTGGEVIYVPALTTPEDSDEAALANTVAPWKD